MKRIKLSRAGMLVNREEFKKDCNILRKDINSLRQCEAIIDDVKADNLQLTISMQIRVMMNYYDVSYRTICEVIRVAHQTLKRELGYYYTSCISSTTNRKEASYLVDRQHYARLIIDGLKTVKEIAEATGYSKMTVYKWTRDYKQFGNKMTNQAIAFRRVL